VSAHAKREYVQAICQRYRQRYRQASRPDKQRILDEFCRVAHYHRKYAIRLLNGPAPGAARPPRRRAATYGSAVIEALMAIWEAAGYPWSVRLKALLPLWLPWARPPGRNEGGVALTAAPGGEEPARRPGAPSPAQRAKLQPPLSQITLVPVLGLL
jgi:hypothetical protein